MNSHYFLGFRVPCTRFIFGLVFALAASQSLNLAHADGTETLGAASVALKQGTNVFAAGTGLYTQPGSIEVDIPAGATVSQVLLYWNGFVRTVNSSCVAAGDTQLLLNGTIPVTGKFIGGGQYIIATACSFTYRADITNLGLISAGKTTLTVGGMTNNFANNGAGIIVIYDESNMTPQTFEMRDGDDFAYYQGQAPLTQTAKQTFTFAPSQVTRTVTIPLFFASVQGPISGGTATRPSSLEVTIGQAKTVISDQLMSTDGNEWDTLVLSEEVPAGVGSLSIQAFSRDDLGSKNTPASMVWVGAGVAFKGVPRPSPSPSPSPSASASPSPTPTATPSASPSATPSMSPSPTPPNCTDIDQSPTLRKLDHGAKLQEAHIKKILAQLIGLEKRGGKTASASTLRYAEKVKKEAHALQIRNWNLSWEIPAISVQCAATTTFCVQVDNIPTLTEYRTNADNLLKLSLDALKRLKGAARASGRKVDTNQLKKTAGKLYDSVIQLSNTIPDTQVQCTQ